MPKETNGCESYADAVVFETAVKAFSVMTTAEQEQVLTTFTMKVLRTRHRATTIKNLFADAVHDWIKS